MATAGLCSLYKGLLIGSHEQSRPLKLYWRPSHIEKAADVHAKVDSNLKKATRKGTLEQDSKSLREALNFAGPQFDEDDCPVLSEALCGS